jgi:hypothetical protein
MLHLFLSTLFLILRRDANQKAAAVYKRTKSKNPSALDLHFTMRAMLPTMSLGGAIYMNIAMFFAYFSNLKEESYMAVFTSITCFGLLQTLLLSAVAIRTAESLVLAEVDMGAKSTELRDGLESDLLFWPLLPFSLTLLF